MAFTVSASMSSVVFTVGIKVYVITNGTGAGGASGGLATSGATPDFSLTPASTNSAVVWGAFNESNSTAFGAAANNVVDNSVTTGGSTQAGDGHYTGTVTGGVAITVGASTPTGINTAAAGYEIQPNGGTPAIDASTTTLTTSATSPVTSASFNPPNTATTVLVAVVIGSPSSSSTPSISDTSGLGLTWTQRVQQQDTVHATSVTIFTAQMPGAGAAVAGTMQPLATVPVPRRKPVRAVVLGGQGQAFVSVPAPKQPPYLPPRRMLARAVWRGAAGAAFVQVAAPRQLPVFPRRKPARAYVQFTPVTTTNAPFKPRGVPPAAPDDKPQLKKILLILS